jgi:hypothetical protein
MFMQIPAQKLLEISIQMARQSGIVGAKNVLHRIMLALLQQLNCREAQNL